MIQEQQKTNCDRVTNDACINPFKLFLKGEHHLKGQKLRWLAQDPFLSAIHPKMNFTVICSVVAAYSSWLLICDLPTHSSPTCMRTHMLRWRTERAAVCDNEAEDWLSSISACLLVCTSNHGLSLSHTQTHTPELLLTMREMENVCVCVRTTLVVVVTSHSSQALISNPLSQTHTHLCTNLIELFPAFCCSILAFGQMTMYHTHSPLYSFEQASIIHSRRSLTSCQTQFHFLVDHAGLAHFA